MKTSIGIWKNTFNDNFPLAPHSITNSECIKKDLILLNPSFQHSRIPSFQCIGLRHSQFSLTPDGGIFDWPKGPGFQWWNKYRPGHKKPRIRNGAAAVALAMNNLKPADRLKKSMAIPRTADRGDKNNKTNIARALTNESERARPASRPPSDSALIAHWQIKAVAANSKDTVKPSQLPQYK